MQCIETLNRQSVVEGVEGYLKFPEIGLAKIQTVHRTQMMVTLHDVIAMSLVYYSRDIGVKSLALYFIE
jgi:hypothetical protein